MFIDLTDGADVCLIGAAVPKVLLYPGVPVAVAAAAFNAAFIAIPTSSG
jgi:hypothetical protein